MIGLRSQLRLSTIAACLYCFSASGLADSIALYSGHFNADETIDMVLLRRSLSVYIVGAAEPAAPDALVHLHLPLGGVVIESDAGRYVAFDAAAQELPDTSLYLPGYHRLVRGDLDGDGLDECLIEAESAAAVSLSVDCSIRESVNIIQILDAKAIGFDLGAPLYTADLSDRNGDGRDDLAILADGGIVAILIADTRGLFTPWNPDDGAEPDERVGVDLTFLTIWSEFTDALDSGDASAAARYFISSVRPRYLQLFREIGPQGLSQVTLSWTRLERISVSQNMAEYAVAQAEDGEAGVYSVVFVRTHLGDWKIGGL